ncbi:MAG TPA: polysaccharide biosynthesis tyrosine autokinase, partial [Acidimicrobiales bacterium]|nr:polysaccharide biosynthesis tyrosine autokinase [Acidimicrobiales bacterium]
MDEQAQGLRDVWRMLLRHRMLIATVTGAMTVAALIFSLTQPKVYSARAQLRIQPPLSEVVRQTLGNNGRNVGEASPDDVVKLLPSSDPIAKRVKTTLKLRNTEAQLQAAIKARVVTDTIIEVTATAPNPALAQALANAFPQAYLDDARETIVSQISEVYDQVAANHAELVRRRDEVGGKIRETDQGIALLTPPAGVALSPQQASDKARLISQRDQQRGEYDQLNRQGSDAEIQLKQLDLGRKVVNAGEIPRPASLPKKPSSPKPAMDVAIGLMMGLIAGVVGAYLRDHFDGRVRTRDDAARSSGTQVLAAVPRLDWKGAPSADSLVSISEPASAAAEQYRTLRANLAAQGLGSSIRGLIVTSPGKGEGKSSTVANLAVACANSGLKTLAVSADPRRPTLHAFFEIPDAPGLPEVLRGHAPLSAAIFMTAIPNLFVLPSRPDPATGSDLLASQRLQEILAEASAHADVVLVDVTSIADGADASILARLVGNCLLVVEADHTDLAAVTRATTTIAQAGARVVGTIVNR